MPFRLPRGLGGALGKGNVNRLHGHAQQIVVVARHGALAVSIDFALVDPGIAHCRRDDTQDRERIPLRPIKVNLDADVREFGRGLVIRWSRQIGLSLWPCRSHMYAYLVEPAVFPGSLICRPIKFRKVRPCLILQSDSGTHLVGPRGLYRPHM